MLEKIKKILDEKNFGKLGFKLIDYGIIETEEISILNRDGFYKWNETKYKDREIDLDEYNEIRIVLKNGKAKYVEYTIYLDEKLEFLKKFELQ